MSKYWIVCLLLSSAIISHAQNTIRIESLKRELAKANEETKLKIFNDLAWEYRSAQPDSAIYYGQLAFDLGQKIKPKEVAKSLNFMGVAYYHKGDNLIAYDYYTRALATAQANQDSLQAGHAANNIGRLFMEQRLLDRAYRFLVKARSIFSNAKDSSGVAYSLQSLAAYHTLTNDKKEAEKNYLEAYRIRLALGNQKDVVSALLQIGKFYLSEHNVNKGLTFFTKADSVSQFIRDALIQAETRIHIAECLLLKGDLINAEKMAISGLTEIKRSANGRLLPEAFLTMGQIEEKKGNVIRAKEYFILALEVSTSRNDLNNRLEAYFFLWQTANYDQQISKDELKSYNEYLQLKDSIRTLELSQREAQFQFQLAIERKEAETTMMRIRNQRKTAVIIILVVSLLSAMLIVYLLLKNKKRILRVNHLLEERNGEIKKKNLVLEEQKNQIEKMNEILEDRVKQRTQELEIQNKRLAEYAFINSHLLRGPLSRILGLINLLDQDKTMEKAELILLLRKSGNELDAIVKKITDALNDGDYLSIKDME